MRVVLDTNILISALMIQVGNPSAIYRAWQEGHFTLLTCAEHHLTAHVFGEREFLGGNGLPANDSRWLSAKRH